MATCLIVDDNVVIDSTSINGELEELPRSVSRASILSRTRNDTLTAWARPQDLTTVACGHCQSRFARVLTSYVWLVPYPLPDPFSHPLSDLCSGPFSDPFSYPFLTRFRIRLWPVSAPFEHVPSFILCPTRFWPFSDPFSANVFNHRKPKAENQSKTNLGATLGITTPRFLGRKGFDLKKGVGQNLRRKLISTQQACQHTKSILEGLATAGSGKEMCIVNDITCITQYNLCNMSLMLKPGRGHSKLQC
jgi:hypothetical protein